MIHDNLRLKSCKERRTSRWSATKSKHLISEVSQNSLIKIILIIIKPARFQLEEKVLAKKVKRWWSDCHLSRWCCWYRFWFLLLILLRCCLCWCTCFCFCCCTCFDIVAVVVHVADKASDNNPHSLGSWRPGKPVGRRWWPRKGRLFHRWPPIAWSWGRKSAHF